MTRKSPDQQLFEIASAQGGYFTAFQATRVGYSGKNHAYHLHSGHWVREWRGIYRLVQFPLQDDSQYSLWGVWSMNRKGEIQGTYSHETALALFDLTDLQPQKMHMTVPRGFRRHGLIPPVLVLHHSNIAASEYEQRNGYRVIKPVRTIVDIVRSGETSPEFIKQAIRQSLDRGYLTSGQCKGLFDLPRIGRKLKDISDGIL